MRLNPIDAGYIFGLGWSPDGKHLALIGGTSTSDAVLVSIFLGSEK